jgi:hypothetical protein
MTYFSAVFSVFHPYSFSRCVKTRTATTPIPSRARLLNAQVTIIFVGSLPSENILMSLDYILTKAPLM